MAEDKKELQPAPPPPPVNRSVTADEKLDITPAPGLSLPVERDNAGGKRHDR